MPALFRFGVGEGLHGLFARQVINNSLVAEADCKLEAVAPHSVAFLRVTPVADQQIKRFGVATFCEQHEWGSSRIGCLGNPWRKLLFIGIGSSFQKEFANFKKLGKTQIPGC